MKYLLLLPMALMMAACGGGISAADQAKIDAAVAAQKAHADLAGKFVASLNTTGSYNLMKSSTVKGGGFIVIYDKSTDQYTAVNITGYDAASDASAFLQTSDKYTKLDVIPAHTEVRVSSEYESLYDRKDSAGKYNGCQCFVDTLETVSIPTRYRDRATDVVFEKAVTSVKDLEKFGALAEAMVIDNRAERLSDRLGLSVDRSREVVRLSMAWDRSGGKDLSARDQDAFSQEMLGFSITDAKKAMKDFSQGSNRSMEQLLDKAAAVNETTPENIQQMIGEIIGQ